MLAVTALGDDATAARTLAYSATDVIEFPGRQLRHDIALKLVAESAGAACAGDSAGDESPGRRRV